MIAVGRVVRIGVLMALLGYNQGYAQVAEECVPSDMATDGNVATIEHPARVFPTTGPNLLSSSPALRIVLRATDADPNSPFLVQIYIRAGCDTEHKTEQLLGSVSFYPLKIGEAQEFVLPAPKDGFPPIRLDKVQVEVKLVPANPARSAEKASVAIEKAQFAG